MGNKIRRRLANGKAARTAYPKSLTYWRLNVGSSSDRVFVEGHDWLVCVIYFSFSHFSYGRIVKTGA